jgi:hypothetical protein
MGDEADAENVDPCNTQTTAAAMCAVWQESTGGTYGIKDRQDRQDVW